MHKIILFNKKNIQIQIDKNNNPTITNKLVPIIDPLKVGSTTGYSGAGVGSYTGSSSAKGVAVESGKDYNSASSSGFSS